MAKEMSKYGVSVDLDEQPGVVLVQMFERIGEDEKEVIASKAFRFADVHDDLKVKVSAYGLSKLLQDRTSSESKDAGRLDSMQNVMDRFIEGQWEKERESSGPTVSVEVEALAEIKGVGVAVIQKALRTYTAEQREKILASNTVQERAAAIKARRDAESETDLDLEGLVAA